MLFIVKFGPQATNGSNFIYLPNDLVTFIVAFAPGYDVTGAYVSGVTVS